MKPKYIFTAVIAVCILMTAVLPHLGGAPRAAAAAPAAVIQPAAMNLLAAARPTVVQAAAAPTVLPTIAPFGNAVQPQAAAPAAAKSAGLPVPAPASAAAAPDIPLTANLPDLASFAASVSNGQTGQAAGVYVPGQFALPIVLQPAGDSNYVSGSDQEVTLYSRPLAYGVTGLLAHNTLSGSQFSGMKIGQDVILIFGDGQQKHFRISHVDRYQALSPDDVHSTFINLADSNSRVQGDEEVFQHIYTTSGELVFQTCIARNGVLSWGRLFITADPS